MDHQKQRISNCTVLNDIVKESITEAKDRITQQTSLKETLVNLEKNETDATEDLEVQFYN